MDFLVGQLIPTGSDVFDFLVGQLIIGSGGIPPVEPEVNVIFYSMNF